jgi:peptide/nickel transport system substrate-binding protein
MTRHIHRIAALATAGLTVAGLAACSSSGSGGGTGATSGKPVLGGTLRIVAASGPDHLDTVPAYYTADYMLERAYARQLLTYPTVPDPSFTSAGWKTDITPVADVATAVPTAANGGITNGGKTYTFHIKQGVDWNTSPPRQVTADDFIREYKAFCNPVSPVGNLGYYSATISGLTQYCDAETAFFTKKSNKPTATNIANYQNTHNISGIKAISSSEIQFNLIQPAGDFIYMLAMPFTSARPVEYDKYVPDSLPLRQHTISDGPYQITSYVPNKSLVMQKDPAWKQSTDTARHQYVNEITLTMGVTSASTQLADMQAGSTGTYDLVNDTGVEPTAIPSLLAKHDPKFKIWPYAATIPYVVFNVRSPNSGGAMKNVKVRQAIEYGINKVAVQKAEGGPAVEKVINTAIPPGNIGYVPGNLYPDKNGQGDPAKCKSTLAAAGYPKGVSLTYLYANDSINSRIFAAIQASLKPCGVNLVGKPEPGSSFFVDLGNSPVNNRAGTWDLGQPGWIADWWGPNGRTIMDPLFKTRCVVNTNNYGCLSDPALDKAIETAEAAPLSQSAALWAKADNIVMKDAAIVPLAGAELPGYSSARVQNAGSTAITEAPNLGTPDITNVWLDPNKP